MAWIGDGVAWLSGLVTNALPPGLLRSMVVDGAIAGVGAVVTFLPQILILFFFILLLEGTGYMVRAAFLMDRLMHGAGLSGRAFIPLLSSFACAVPGIMATRTIDDPKDRLTTILVAPLMTCSARLPVYTLIIAAFIPNRNLGCGVGLQGLVMLRALYHRNFRGSARRLRASPRRPQGRRRRLHDGAAQISDAFAQGCWDRPPHPRADLPQACWHDHPWDDHRPLGTRQHAPSRARSKAERSFDRRAHRHGHRESREADRLQSRHRARFASGNGGARSRGERDRDGLFARSSGDNPAQNKTLVEKLRHRWPLPTALAFLAWFVFAPQCISTIAVTRRETNGWKWPLVHGRLSVRPGLSPLRE